MPDIVELPSGEFDIGDDSIPNASPKHRRRLSRSVWIDARAVTWGHFETFVAAGGYQNPEFWSSGQGGFPMPSTAVDKRCRTLLEDAESFRRILSKSGKMSLQQPVTALTWFESQAVARFFGARLPFEVEWEVAMTEENPATGLTASVWEELPLGSFISKYGCVACYGFLQEWTADAFSRKYWKADSDRRGTPWTPRAGGAGVTVRGSSTEEIYHHRSFRFSQDPASSDGCRSFRRVWDEHPAADLVQPHWRAG